MKKVRRTQIAHRNHICLCLLQDQHILLHRRLAIILDRLTRQAENETQEHVKNLERILRKSNDNVDVMTAHVERFETMTLRLKNIIGSALSDSAQVC